MVVFGEWVFYVVEERYMLLRFYVNMNVSIGSVMVCSAAIGSVYNSPLRILEYPGRQARILTCSGPIKTLAPTLLFFLLHSVV